MSTVAFDERMSLSCDGDREKKAVSEAEAAAEHRSKSIVTANPAIRPAEETRSTEAKFKIINALTASGSGSATVRNN